MRNSILSERLSQCSLMSPIPAVCLPEVCKLLAADSTPNYLIQALNPWLNRTIASL